MTTLETPGVQCQPWWTCGKPTHCCWSLFWCHQSFCLDFPFFLLCWAAAWDHILDLPLEEKVLIHALLLLLYYLSQDCWGIFHQLQKDKTKLQIETFLQQEIPITLWITLHRNHPITWSLPKRNVTTLGTVRTQWILDPCIVHQL